jgi:hypothetical protein
MAVPSDDVSFDALGVAVDAGAAAGLPPSFRLLKGPGASGIQCGEWVLVARKTHISDRLQLLAIEEELDIGSLPEVRRRHAGPRCSTRRHHQPARRGRRRPPPPRTDGVRQ